MMPPWNAMSPQQQQMLLSLMMNRGNAGMQFGIGAPQVPGTPGAPVPGGQVQLQPSGLTSAMQGMPANPLANQMGQNQMNPMLMRYLMGMQGMQGGGGMQQPSLAQLLSSSGGNTWGLGL